MNDDYMLRLGGMLPLPVIFVDADKVNIDDLLNPNAPGQIVRCYGDPNISVKWIEPLSQADALGCVAGWISEEP